MHSPHHVEHVGEGLGRLVNDEIDAVVLDREVVVGDQSRDLDDHISVRVEAGHLEVHPHQHGGDPT